MKPSRFPVATRRNLGLGLGIGLSLGLGLLSVELSSISQASSTLEEANVHIAPLVNRPTMAADQPTDEQSRQRSPHIPVVASTSPDVFTPDDFEVMDASTVSNRELEHSLNQTISGLAACPYRSETTTQGLTKTTSETTHAHRYAYHAVDLNGDRQDELMVQIMGPMTCGTGGCTTLILQESESHRLAYEVVTQMSVVNFPVIVSDRTSSGWSDLFVMVSGGGAQPGYRLLKFDGQSYPSNPSLESMVSGAEQPNGKVLTVSEEAVAIAPILKSADCDA